jgi:hypothetical protein
VVVVSLKIVQRYRAVVTASYIRFASGDIYAPDSRIFIRIGFVIRVIHDIQLIFCG